MPNFRNTFFRRVSTTKKPAFFKQAPSWVMFLNYLTYNFLLFSRTLLYYNNFMRKIIFCALALLVIVFLTEPARPLHAQVVGDWYIKNFDAQITLDADSSLTITEKIVADCPGCYDKHGIFRVLPTQTKTITGKKITTPIVLESITDFSGKKYPLETITSKIDHTITWKIGDANKEAQGINNYLIKYQVKNAIRAQENFDELYWNILGNFWDIPIDNFSSDITFLRSITQQNSTIDYYTGLLGSKNTNLAKYSWQSDNVLHFQSTRSLLPGEGITASVSFPKNIVTPYIPSFWEQYGNYLFYLIPLLIFLYGYKVWSKYGKDPKLRQAIVPEYEAPDDLTPMELSALLSSYGSVNDKAISATIIKLATAGHITIKDARSKWSKNFEITRINSEIKNPEEKALLDAIMLGKDTTTTSELKKRTDLYTVVSEIKKAVKQRLSGRNYFEKTNKAYVLGLSEVIFIALMFISFSYISNSAGIASFLSFVIILVFLLLMPRRTEKGAQALWKIKGFKMYMETAEKYRQQFYEKENIFEKLLPYAMVFGIATLWIKKMKDIYGDKYFSSYHPVWLVDSSGSGFDVGSFSSELNSISSAISSSAGTSSGAGGGGSSGGGGGGGGGGGW